MDSDGCSPPEAGGSKHDASVSQVGTALGAGGCYYAVVRDLDRFNDRLDVIQQQIAANALTTEAKPTAVPSTKAHHGNHAAAAPSTP